VAELVVFGGPDSLGQGDDACQALLELTEAEGEVPRPVLDLDLLRRLLAGEREAGPPGIPPSPTTLSRFRLSPFPPEDPFQRQVPIYLLPAQASVQAGFLVRQQGEPLLPMFIRRLFRLGEPEERS